MPEAIQYTETESTPVYGTIVAVAGVDVTVRLLSTRTRPCKSLPQRFNTVNGGPGEWVCKAVVGISCGQYATGQVIAYNRNYVTIRTLRGEFRSSVDGLGRRRTHPVLSDR
ncbi:hypothetical protein GQ600_7048 [Phytophthora cactorum]|nr:hypothetical protein GQ600_7048 [Phytophthora cactorum]